MSPQFRPQEKADLPAFLELPPGKIAAIATYLEMRAAPRVTRSVGGRFESLAGDVGRYRALFAQVGRPWLWSSRAGLSDAELCAIIDDPGVDALAFVENGRDVGLVEVDARQGAECELAFLGLVPGAIGRGYGRAMAEEAIGLAFAAPIGRLWLHTCTLDHPGALSFYQHMGFKPYRRAVEIADDPRLTGRLPRDAAPGYPIL